jgi:PII interaction protein X
VDVHENTDSYLNHPTLGLLYSVCVLEEKQELFTTIYAKRLFFLVTTTPTASNLNQLVVPMLV